MAEKIEKKQSLPCCIMQKASPLWKKKYFFLCARECPVRNPLHTYIRPDLTYIFWMCDITDNSKLFGNPNPAEDRTWRRLFLISRFFQTWTTGTCVFWYLCFLVCSFLQLTNFQYHQENEFAILKKSKETISPGDCGLFEPKYSPQSPCWSMCDISWTILNITQPIYHTFRICM